MQAFEGRSVSRRIFAWLACAYCLNQGLARADDNWTTNQVYSPADTNEYSFLRDVAYGDGRFVAVGEKGDYGLLYSSTNGIDWSGNSNWGGWFGAIAYGDGVFAATGGPFGLTLLLFNVAPGIGSGPNPDTGGPFSITCGGGRVMIAYGNKVSYTTAPPGDSWTNATLPNLTNNYDSLRGICYGAGKYVAISAEDNAAHWTTTGRTWGRAVFPIPAPPGGYWLITFNNGLFTVPYAAGTNLLSADGTHWAAVATQIPKRFFSVTFVNGLFAANAGGTLVFSKDGTNYVESSFRPLPVSKVISDGFRLCGVNGRNFYAHDAPAGLLEMGSAPGQLILYGAIGGSYRIEYADSISSSGAFLWHTLTNFTLPDSPYGLSDASVSGASARYYRAVLTH